MKKTVSDAIEIDASPMAVWAILIDLGRYGEWNPLFREAAGEIAVGKRGRLKSFLSRRPITIRPKSLAAESGADLRWVASLPGIIGGEHSFVLSPRNGGTRLVQSETFHGLLVAVSCRVFTDAE